MLSSLILFSISLISCANFPQSESSPTLQISSSSTESSPYFYPVDMAYDGLRINESYLSYTNYFQTINNVNWGNGGAFEVDFNPLLGQGFCVDGDTTAFAFPSVISELITASPKRVRYFNVDTPEISGVPQKWGLLAKQYVCEKLYEAEQIYIQTDPGDKLLDLYGRLLGWIWIKLPSDDKLQLLNYWIVRQGLGEVRYLFGAGETSATTYGGKTYTEWMYVAQQRAMVDRYGMHSTLLDPYQ
jgi:endonuclease YncB( thermonuclease family)